MYEQLRLKQIRKTYSAQGWALLIYYGILNAAVMVIMVVQGVILGLSASSQETLPDVEEMTELLVAESGWGYLIAIVVGLIVLLLWKKTSFFFGTIWQKGETMKPGAFFGIFAIFVSAQLGVQLLYMLLEYVCNLMGLSMAASMESASASSDSLSMFLYIGLGAPISEELLFRGLVLRSMEPYGKKFAVFASALMFGLYHGNIIQIPFAFVVGLVLGYVTVEYNIGWAILLHMFNNLILGDSMTRLTSLLPQPWSDLSYWILIIGCAIAAVLVLVTNRHRIRVWLQCNHDEPQCAAAFWSAPGIITLVCVLVVLTVVSMGAMVTVMS